MRGAAAARGALTLSLLCGGLSAPATGQAATLASGIGSGTVSGLGDRAVWSVPTGRDGDYRLVQSVAGAPAQRVRGVAVRRGPFDIDLGRDRAGRMVATYSRCRSGRPSTPSGMVPVARFDRASGCRIYQHRFGARGEALLLEPRRGWSAYRPARWGGLLATAELDEERSRNAPGSVWVVVRDLRSEQRWRFRGTDPDQILGWEPAGPGPLFVDLRGDQLAYSWAEALKGCGTATDYSTPLRTEIWAAAARGGTPQRLAERCSGASPFYSVLGVAVLPSGDVLYGRTEPIPHAGEDIGRFVVADHETGASTTLPVPMKTLSSVSATDTSLLATTYLRNGDVVEVPFPPLLPPASERVRRR